MQRILIGVIITLIMSCAPPTEMVTSDKLAPNCHCEGSGNYNIVMEAGMGNWSLFYQPLFQKLKQTHQVCIIDRPGYAMDSVTILPRDLKTVANELNKVLTDTKINDNIILVGHSLGGLYMRQYQALFPKKVKGLVLLDAAHSYQFKKLPKQFYEIMKAQPKQLEEVIAIARKGYLKYTKGKIPTFGLPENLLDQYYAVTTKPEYYYSMKMEVAVFEDNLNSSKLLNKLKDLPLLVVGSKNSMDKDILPVENKDYPYEKHNTVWFELQKELAELSTNSTFVASKKNHYLNITDADLIERSINSWLKNNVENEQ